SSDTVCSAGMCQESCSDPGRIQCENSCVDVLTHPSHCGGCGTACSGDQICQGGICTGEPDLTGGGGTGGEGVSYSTEVVLQESELGQCEVDGVVESAHSGFTGT